MNVKHRWLTTDTALYWYDLTVNEFVMLVYEGLPVYNRDGIRVIERQFILSTYTEEPKYVSDIDVLVRERRLTSGFETLFDRTEGCYRFDSPLFFSDVRKGRYRVRPSDVEHYLNIFDTYQGECNNIQSRQSVSDDVPSVGACDQMAHASNEAVEVSDETKAGKQATTPLELDKEECRNIAKRIWESDPEKPISTVAREIASGEHVVGSPCEWREGRKGDVTVRKWIEGCCPNRRQGRPRKNP